MAEISVSYDRANILHYQQLDKPYKLIESQPSMYCYQNMLGLKDNSLSGSLKNVAHDARVNEGLKYFRGVIIAVVVVNRNLVHPNRLVIRDPLRQKTPIVLRPNASGNLTVRVIRGGSFHCWHPGVQPSKYNRCENNNQQPACDSFVCEWPRVAKSIASRQTNGHGHLQSVSLCSLQYTPPTARK